MSRVDYREHFRRPEAVAAYLRSYAADAPTADRLAWVHQRRYLVGLLGDLAGRRVLDYACGGGRVLGVLAGCGAEAHGWDASPAMLQACRRAVPAGLLRRVDLLSDGDPGLGRFDVVTAFRLLLNLEPERRAVLLRRLAALLADGGLLVVDNHGNRRSLRHLALLASRRRRPGFANELADREVRALLAGAGLRVLHRAGFGWLPDCLHRHRLSAPLARRVDAFLLARTRSPRLAIRVLYVAGRPATVGAGAPPTRGEAGRGPG